MVKVAETAADEPAPMPAPQPDRALIRRAPTRRAALALGLGALAAGLAPPALATPRLGFPLRRGLVRVGPEGFIPLGSGEQTAWSGLAARLGGLADAIVPLQRSSLLFPSQTAVRGGPSCALVARKLAASAGFEQVILYATDDGRKTTTANGDWLAGFFAFLDARFGKDHRATGEAHILDIAGGEPVISAFADAAPRDKLDVLGPRRKPVREVLDRLIDDLESRIMRLAASAYEQSRSIAG